jgi:hypothetical protein
MAEVVTKWDWSIDLDSFIGRAGSLLTLDGTYRQGRISAIKMRSLELAGETVQWPEAIELNGDLEDLIPFDRLRSVKVE